jgi:lysozyme
MRVSSTGLRLVAGFEGLRTHAYPDAATPPVWTIGYGHTPARPGQTMTKARALQVLKADLRTAESAVNRLVHVPINQHRFDALVSLVFNIGTGAFAKSTLLRKLNHGDYKGASAQFMAWNKAGNGPLPGLTRRRAIERALFDTKA